MSTEPHPTHDVSSDADTALAEGRRPALVGPEQQQQRRAIEVALFGGEAEATTFGRYRLLQRLGRGGMGSVYAAYDDHLERKIAVKLIHTTAMGSAETRERTLREARALARLSHPNVVHAYEVGEVEGQLFVAMEFVAGPTLRAWLDAAARGWRDVLAVLQQAGAGLAAAHAEGVVHRDFKPHNVMLGADGRVRVLDFGLARLGDAEESRPDDGGTTMKGSVATLTRTGTLLGTPAYMAPEQCARGKADARSDQFAFCVVLYEALYGLRPFAGDSLGDLMDAIVGGRVAARPKETSVPQWVHAVVLRGLQVEPERRWPSMPALLAALERDPRARVRRVAAVAGLLLGVGAVAGGVEAHRRWDVAQRTAVCEAAGASIDAVWNDDARRRLRAAFAATGVHYAVTSAERTIPWIDAAAAAWQQQRTGVCLNAEVQRAWGPDLIERALWCLELRQIDMNSMIEEFDQATDATIVGAVPAASSLTTTASCLDEANLLRQVTPPEQERQAIREAYTSLARVNALEFAGKFEEGLALATKVREQVEATIAWAPVRAKARGHEGSLLMFERNFEAAAAALRDAYFLAAGAGDWSEATSAATTLINVERVRGNSAEALIWERHANVALAQAGDPLGVGAAYILSYAALAHDDSEWRELSARAVTLLEAALGRDHPDVAMALQTSAVANMFLGDDRAARPLLARAAEILARAQGEDHPEYAKTLEHLGRAIARDGDVVEAESMLRRALTLMEAAFGAESSEAVNTANVLASLLADRKPDEALALFDRCVAIKAKLGGGDDGDLGDVLVNRSELYTQAGRHAEALADMERAVPIAEQRSSPKGTRYPFYLSMLARAQAAAGLRAQARTTAERAAAMMEERRGPDDTNVAEALGTLGVVLMADGAYAAARAPLTRAVKILEKAWSPEHPMVAAALVDLADLELAMGRPGEALVDAKRATTVLAAQPGAQPNESSAYFTLARALAATGGDQTRALDAARRAREAFVESNARSRIAEVDAWLAEQDRKAHEADAKRDDRIAR